MRDSITDNSEDKLIVGLDVGDRHTQVCVLDESGEVVEEARVATTPKALTRRFAGMTPARLVIEVGTHSHWISRLLHELGHEVIIANPRMLRFIYGNNSKSDRADAAYLARVGRLDPSLLSPVVHRSETRQADLALLRSREALVRTRANLVNHARGMVKVFGARLPMCSTDAFAKKCQDQLPEALGTALGPVVEIISALTVQIQGLERKIEALARESYPETALLRQVPGVGTLTSLAFVLTVEDPARFARARAVGSYLGLRPRQADSGALKPQLRITKAGDEMLRSLLVECAHHILSWKRIGCIRQAEWRHPCFFRTPGNTSRPAPFVPRQRGGCVAPFQQRCQPSHACLLVANYPSWGSLPRGVASLWDSSRRFTDPKDDRFHPLWLTLALTGLRRGEILGLLWQDVDLKAGRLVVRRSLVPVNADVVISEPKTRRGHRSVTLDPVTASVLETWRRRQRDERLEWGPTWTNQAWCSRGRMGPPGGRSE